MSYPHIQTNANNIEYIAPSVLRKGSIPRFRVIASTLVTGPENLFVVRTSNLEDFTRHFERILHIELRVTNTMHSSWSIFRQDRHWEDTREDSHFGLVLRHSIWDIKTDFAGRSFEKPNLYPNVTTAMYYVNDGQEKSLIPYIQELDTLISSGMHIIPRPDFDVWEWKELLVARLFDWGYAELSWSYSKHNLQSEKVAFRITYLIENIIENQRLQNITVESINMKYDILPQEVAILVTSSNEW